MRVIGYTRVSTDEQASGGSSLAAQAEKIRLYCELHGHELIRIESDPGGSGKDLDRPGVQTVLTALRSRTPDAPEGLVIPKLDRLTRSVRDFLALMDEFFVDGAKRRRSLLSVADTIDTSTATGRFMVGMLMGFAQWERETIGERTRDTLQSKIRRGERVGKVRFGDDLKSDGKHLAANDAERSAIGRMACWRADGASFREICRRLDADGVPTKEGGSWRPATVRRILLRAATAPGPGGQ